MMLATDAAVLVARIVDEKQHPMPMSDPAATCGPTAKLTGAKMRASKGGKPSRSATTRAACFRVRCSAGLGGRHYAVALRDCALRGSPLAQFGDLPDVIGIVDEAAQQVSELAVAHVPAVKQRSGRRRLNMGT